MLLIWTREEHVEHVSNISADTVGNGESRNEYWIGYRVLSWFTTPQFTHMS